MSDLRGDVLAVMRDGSRIDRFLEATCADDPPVELFLTTRNTAHAQYEVPVCMDSTEYEEASSVDAIIQQALTHLSEVA